MISIGRQHIVHDNILVFCGRVFGLRVFRVIRSSGEGVWSDMGFPWDVDGDEAEGKCLHLEIEQSRIGDAGHVLTAKGSQQRFVVKTEDKVWIAQDEEPTLL